MATKSNTKSGALFIGESGQLRLVDKSAEQRAMEDQKVECLGISFATDQERRRHFLRILQEKLADPEFRKLPGFPKGNDEDIIRLSDPPYYTACPNPFLADFCSTQEGGPSGYHRSPYSLDLAGAKNDDVYNAHGYHTKVPPSAIERLISHYTREGDVVLDPFAGSGMTGIAAARLGRVALLVDLSPAATAIADGYVHTKGNLSEDPRCREIIRSAGEKWGWLYETTHNGWDASIRTPAQRVLQRSGPSEQVGEIQFVVWSDVFVCPECGSDIVFWKSAVDFDAKSARQEFSCAHCSTSVGKRDLERRWETVYDPSLRVARSKAVRQPVLINYAYRGRRFEKTPDQRDAELLSRVRQLQHVPYLRLRQRSFNGYRDPLMSQRWRKVMS